MRQLILTALALATTALPTAAQTRQVTLNRAWSWGATSGTTYGGVYIGPYGASSPGLPNFDVFCVDFVNSVRVGDTWTARFTSLADLMGGSGLDDTRWGQRYLGAPLSYPDPVPLYQKAAWLATQFATHSKTAWPGIHQAIWRQFTSSPTWTGTDYTTWMANANTAASNGSFDNIDWKYWYVVTDVNTVHGTGGKQEYLTYITPEPGTLLLLATGLAVVIGYAVVSRRFV
jgi:hypothetical protein